MFVNFRCQVLLGGHVWSILYIRTTYVTGIKSSSINNFTHLNVKSGGEPDGELVLFSSVPLGSFIDNVGVGGVTPAMAFQL